MRQQAARLVAQLSEFGLTLSQEKAAVLVTERVETVARLMRISPRQARRYFNVEAVASSIANSLQEELPGVDLFEQPRDVGVPIGLVGRLTAGLAEAITVRIANESAATALTNTRSLAGCLSALGQFIDMTSGPDGDAAFVDVPRAFVYRAARELEAAANIVEEAGTAPGELASYGAEGSDRLATTFRSDAEMLRVIADTTPHRP